MENGNFPTSRDIYLEVNGRKLAVVEGYKAHSARESHYVEAFGSAEPVGTVPGKTKHFVELSRVYACEGALDDGVSFFELSGFNLVIVKPDAGLSIPAVNGMRSANPPGSTTRFWRGVSLIASHRMELA
mgnify:CR=1 FL=1